MPKCGRAGDGSGAWYYGRAARVHAAVIDERSARGDDRGQSLRSEERRVVKETGESSITQACKRHRVATTEHTIGSFPEYCTTRDEASTEHNCHAHRAHAHV